MKNLTIGAMLLITSVVCVVVPTISSEQADKRIKQYQTEAVRRGFARWNAECKFVWNSRKVVGDVVETPDTLRVKF